MFKMRPVPEPDAFFSTLYRKIPKHIMLCFISACIFGLLCHLYIFTSKYFNLDDLSHIFLADYGTASGRWLLPLANQIAGAFSTPWLTGIISTIFLAIAACLTVSVFKIRRPLGCILTAALLVSFPSVTSTFSYMFTADAYFFSIALACFAAYITNRYRFGFIGGVVAIILSMAIYQSYFGVTAVMLIAVLIFDCVDGTLDLKQLLLKALKFLAVLVVGIGIYMITAKLASAQYTLVDYMGISQMGNITLSEQPTFIKNAYMSYYNFFISDVWSVHFSFTKYLLILSLLAAAFLGIWLIVKKKLPARRIILLILLVIAYPLAGAIIYVMVPSVPMFIHLLMLYGLVYLLVALIALSDHYIGYSCDKKPVLGNICSWIIVLSLAVTVYGYAVASNEAYLKMELSYNQAYAYSTNLVSAIEQTEGYDKNIPVVLVGEAMTDIEFPPTPELDRIKITGVTDAKGIVTSYTYGHFLRSFVGLSNIIYSTSTAFSTDFAENFEVDQMPAYPADGFVEFFDDFMIVNLG